jgi:hypothetical protein
MSEEAQALREAITALAVKLDGAYMSDCTDSSVFSAMGSAHALRTLLAAIPARGAGDVGASMTLRPMTELPTADGDYIVVSVSYLDLGNIELERDRFTVDGGWKRIEDGCMKAKRGGGGIIGALRRRAREPEPDLDHFKDCEGPHYIGWSPMPEKLAWEAGWEAAVRTKMWGPPGSKAKR